MQWGLCGAEHLERVRDAPGLEQFEYQVRFPHVCIHPLRQRPGLKPDPCYRKIQAAKPFDYDLGIAATLASRTIPRSRGIDSLIELASAGVLMWRLSVELKHGRAFSEAAEHTASRIAGGLLFALAVYALVAAGWGLWHREGQGFSLAGPIVTALAIPVMYLLAKRKLSVAVQLGSRALRADAVEAVAWRLAFLRCGAGPAGPARDRGMVDRLRDLAGDPLVSYQGRARGMDWPGMLRG
jgi:hypothetical protein